MARTATARADVPGLADWSEADDALRQLGTVEARIAQKNAQLTEEVNRLTEQVEQLVRPLELEKQRLERDLEEFCAANRKDFGKAKSKKLNFGTVAWRKFNRVEVPDPDATVEALKDKGLTELLNVRETPNKDALKKQAPDVVASVGAKLISGDRFEAKPDRKKVVLTEDA